MNMEKCLVIRRDNQNPSIEGLRTIHWPNKIEKSEKNTTMPQHFQTPIQKSQKEGKSIPLIHDWSLSWLGIGTSIKW